AQETIRFPKLTRLNEVITGAFALYQFEFTLLLSNEAEAVVFASQRFRYRHTNTFVSAEEFPQKGKDWYIDVEVNLDTEMNVRPNVRALKAEFSSFTPFLKKGDTTIQETEQILTKLGSPSTSIPSLLMRFDPAMMLLSSDIAGGQTYNIIPS